MKIEMTTGITLSNNRTYKHTYLTMSSRMHRNITINVSIWKRNRSKRSHTYGNAWILKMKRNTQMCQRQINKYTIVRHYARATIYVYSNNYTYKTIMLTYELVHLIMNTRSQRIIKWRCQNNCSHVRKKTSITM